MSRANKGLDKGHGDSRFVQKAQNRYLLFVEPLRVSAQLVGAFKSEDRREKRENYKSFSLYQGVIVFYEEQKARPGVYQ